MSDVIFDEGPMRIPTVTAEHHGGIVGFLLKRRIAKTAGQAQLLLLSAAALIFIISGFLWYASLKGTKVDTTSNLVPAVSTP